MTIQKIAGRPDLLANLDADQSLRCKCRDDFADRYDELLERFCSHFSESFRQHQIENAKYHKLRYIDLCKETFSGKVVDVGNDKPFIVYFLRELNPKAAFLTISYGIPETPVDLYDVDIEQEALPLNDGEADQVIFTEVLEHLWRDPAFAVHQLNRVMRLGGEAFVTTPNACELHAIECILWQANPNQRNQFYSRLESGHLHLWTAQELRILFESNGFDVAELRSYDAYRYTNRSGRLMEIAREISPHVDMMGESLVLRAVKSRVLERPFYDPRLFPEGGGVRFEGAVRNFASKFGGL